MGWTSAVLFLQSSVLVWASLAVSAPADSFRVRRELKNSEFRLPCSKQYCVKSCGFAGLKSFTLDVTGFPMEKGAKKLNLNVSFVPEKVITNLVASVNLSVQLDNSPGSSPFTWTKTFNLCGGSAYPDSRCPLPALEKFTDSAEYSLEGPYSTLVDDGVEVTFDLQVVDQTEQVLACMKGQPVV